LGLKTQSTTLSFLMASELVRVAVTGASGYVGSLLVADLAKRKYSVNAVVRKAKENQDLTTLGPNIALCEVPDLITGDFSHSFKGCKYVIHAASPVIMESEDPENQIIKPAVEGTLNVLKHALKAGVKRVVYTATIASICGSQRDKDPNHVWNEQDWNDRPGTDYSRSKTLAEKAAWDFIKSNPGLELVTIHPAYIIGPINRASLKSSWSISMLVELLQGEYNEKGVPQFTSGITDIRDVSEAHILAMENPKAAGQRYIAALTDQFSALEIAQSVAKQFPELSVPNFEEEPTKPRKNGTNNKKVQEQLGLKFHTFDDSVRDSVLSFKQVGILKK